MLRQAGIALGFVGAAAVPVIVAAWIIAEVIDQATMRSAYQVWIENQTFVAAIIAVAAAALAARPVYMQVKAQSVTAALDLLHRIEAESQANLAAHRRLYDVRRAALNLSAEINAYDRDLDVPGLKAAIRDLLAFNARDMRDYADHLTISRAEGTQHVALGVVLSITQKVALGILVSEKDGMIPVDVVAAEKEFMTVQLAGLFGMASDIADDLEAQMELRRARAAELRSAANTAWI